MGEVKYSVNGVNFKQNNVIISDSEGIIGALDRKKITSYDWAEYHGSSPDLSAPRYEARKITLKGFVTGTNWEVMKSNYDQILSEFQKPGTQRLLIEPFGLKALPYEVYLDDGGALEKKFKDGQMIGFFTLKLIEPNPIKKVLSFSATLLNLSYSSPTETEIFYGDGTKDIVPGNASMSAKPLPAGLKYIIIAGDIDKITNLTTNATTLWGKL